MSTAPPIPVLFLESRAAHGGDVQVLFDILNTLDLVQLAPIVACLPDGPVANWAGRPAGVELLPLSFGSGGSGLRGLLSTAWPLRSLVARRGIKVVHANNTRRTLTAALLLKVLAPRIRLIYHAHCEPQPSLSHRLALRAATRVWAVSRFIAEAYREAGVPAFKLVEMPNGFDFDAPWPDSGDWRERLHLPANVRVAALIGRLTPHKGQALMVEAMACPEVPANVHLVLVGDDSISDSNTNYRQGLLDRARELGLADRVHLTGFVADPRPIYALADVVLLPSLREPFGLTALEAAAARRMVVATDGGGFREILGEVGGLPLCQRTPQALAIALRDRLTHGQTPTPSELRQRLMSVYSLQNFGQRVRQQLLALAQPQLSRGGRS